MPNLPNLAQRGQLPQSKLKRFLSTNQYLSPVWTLFSTLGVIALLAGAACSARASMPDEQLPIAGTLFIVGGVGGIDLLPTTSKLAMPHAGVAHEIRNFEWTHGKGKILKDLQDTQHSNSHALRLASVIRKAKEENPDRPVFILARSGGTALALAAAEILPEQSIDRIILLSAAVAPNYDLRPALRATRLGVVSFYSALDIFVLGWGTGHFGTMDRAFGPSAGLTGFKPPRELSTEDRELYGKLIQIPWRPGLAWQGNYGGHLGTAMPGFIAHEVSPWLLP